MKKLPQFKRQNWAQKRRVCHTGWRKPRGIDNKLRISLRSAGFLPKIGFRTPRKERGAHPTGLMEALVSSVKQLGALDPTVKIAIRISSVGGKKRELIAEAAEKAGFKVLNPPPRKKKAESSEQK